jgi:hypothetical protein
MPRKGPALLRHKGTALLRHKGTAKIEKIRGEGKDRGLSISYEDGRKEIIVSPEAIRARFKIEQ